MWGFVIVPAVTVSDCLFRGVQGFCVNVWVPLQLFSLVSPSVWHLSIVTDGCASSDWSLGPMLVCVCLGDVCVMLGSSLVFLVFFVYVLIRKKVCHIYFITTATTAKAQNQAPPPSSPFPNLHPAATNNQADPFQPLVAGPSHAHDAPGPTPR